MNDDCISVSEREREKEIESDDVFLSEFLVFASADGEGGVSGESVEAGC